MTDRSVDAQPPSEQTGNEISGGSQVGGNAYQAKNIHFGGRSVGLTVVALALVGALTALVLTDKGGEAPDQPAGTPAPSTAAPTPTPSTSTGTPSATVSSSSSGTPKTEEAARPSAAPRATSKPLAATGSNPYSAGNLYCGAWRSSGHSPNLKVASCVRVDVVGAGATFGAMVKNVGKSQVVAQVLVKYSAKDGVQRECPQGAYAPEGIRIDPEDIWFSDLSSCSVGGLDGTDFQGVARAVEDPDGTVSPTLGTARSGPHPTLKNGQLTCRQPDGSSGTCASFTYPPAD